MKNNLKRINLVFENVEYLEIPIEHISHFKYSDVKPEKFANEMFDVAGHIELSIQNAHMLKNNTLHFPEDLTAKDRIVKWCDITCIELVDQNNNTQTIYAKWHPDDEYSNSYQKNQMNNNNITIIIQNQEEK